MLAPSTQTPELSGKVGPTRMRGRLLLVCPIGYVTNKVPCRPDRVHACTQYHAPSPSVPCTCFKCMVQTNMVHVFFFCNRPALSSDKALGFTPGLCISAAGRSTVTRYIVWPKRQTWICACRGYQCMVVQRVLPRQSNPKYSGIQGFNKDSLGFLSVRFHKLAVVQRHVSCPLHSKSKPGKVAFHARG